MQGTRMLIDDAGARAFVRVNVQSIKGETRHYYVARDPSALAIVVCRHALELPQLTGQVADAALGWEERSAKEFVLAANVGKRHSKATLYRVLDDAGYDLTLSDFLNNAPKSRNERSKPSGH